MALRGPNAKPTFLRLLEGNPGKRPFNPNEAKVPLVNELPTPTWFNERQAAIWQDVTRGLAAMKGLSWVDLQMLILYVDTLAECERIMMKMQELGESVMPVFDKNGKAKGTKGVAWFSQLQELKSLALRFATHFGMTPSARARIVFLGELKDQDSLDDPFAVRR